MVASAGLDGWIRLWNAATGAEEGELREPSDGVKSLSFSPDSTTLASGSYAYDGAVRLWDLASRTCIDTLDAVYPAVAYSPDGKTLAYSTGTDIKLLDLATGAVTHSLTGHAIGITSMAFSPDGSLLASGSNDFTARVWDLTTGASAARLTGHAGYVKSVAFSPDGAMLASGSFDQTIKLWDVATYAEIATLHESAGGVDGVAFSPDETSLASGANDGTIRLWDLATHSTRWVQPPLQHYYVHAVAYSPDATTVASGSGDGTIRLWDAATGALLHTLTGHSDKVLSLAISQDAFTLASASEDGSIRVWNMETGAQRWARSHTFYGTPNAITFSPDGSELASGHDEVHGFASYGYIWDAATGQEITKLGPYGGLDFQSVAYSPDGNSFAMASVLNVVLFDLPSYSEQGYINAFDATSIAFADGGAVLASADQNVIRLWDPTSRTLVATLTGHTGTVWTVAAGPDGTTVASGSGDKTIRVWALATHTSVGRLVGHTGAVRSVAISPGSNKLVSGADDGTIRLWECSFCGFAFTRDVEDQTFTVGEAASVVLPESSGGTAPLSYALFPSLPGGLTFDRDSRKITGIPTGRAEHSVYTYSVVDANGKTASKMFGIRVAAPVAFLDVIGYQSFLPGRPIVPLALPKAVGGAPPVRYVLDPALPAGLAFDAAAGVISGTPAELTPPALYTFMAIGSNGSMDRLNFIIAVEPLPVAVSLVGNYPNPFQQTTQILLDLPSAADVSVEVMDMLGRAVVSKPTTAISGGSNRSITFNGELLASGMYVYRVTVTTPEGTVVLTGSFVRAK